jgi:hypothetical protein
VLRAVSSFGRLVASVAGPALYGWYQFDLDLLWGGLFWLALGVRARAAVVSTSCLFSYYGCGYGLCTCCIVVRWAWCGTAWLCDGWYMKEGHVLYIAVYGVMGVVRCGMGVARGAHGRE